MRTRIVLFFWLAGHTLVQAQVLTQDAQGNSTIFYNGGVTGIDLLRTQANVSYNNVFNTKPGTLDKFVFGVTGMVKNQGDLIGVIKSGNFKPKIDLSIKVGGVHYLSGSERMLGESEERISAINAEIAALNPQTADSIKIKQLYAEMVNLQDIRSKNDLTTPFSRIVYFFEGSFTHTEADILNDTTPSTQIDDRVYGDRFNSGALKFGLNYEYNTWLLGTRMALGSTDNLAILHPEAITIVYGTDSLQGGQTQKTDVRNAYTGSDVQRFGYFGWDFDAIKFIPVQKNGTAQGTVVLDLLYARYIKNLSYGSNLLNIGASINYFGKDGKFFGGVYLQLNNASDWHTGNPNDKFQFGFVTRFNFVPVESYSKQ